MPPDTLQIDGRQEFLTGLGLGPEYSQHTAGDHRHIRFVHTPRRHAFVGGLDNNADAKRLQHAAEAFGDLRRHLFLNLQTLCVDVDKARQLRDANYTVAGKIADVNAADDWRDMMFAVRFEADVAQQHNFIVAPDLFERSFQIFTRIIEIACKPLLISAHDTGRRSEQSFAIGI